MGTVIFSKRRDGGKWLMVENDSLFPLLYSEDPVSTAFLMNLPEPLFVIKTKPHLVDQDQIYEDYMLKT